MRTSSKLALLGLVVGLGCSSDPVSSQLPGYYQTAQGILADNAKVSNIVREFNAKEGSKDAERGIKLMEKLAPELKKVADQAKAIDMSGTPFVELHAQLVSGLEGKHQAYQKMVKAFRKNDTDAFNAARKEFYEAMDKIAQFENELERLRRGL